MPGEHPPQQYQTLVANALLRVYPVPRGQQCKHQLFTSQLSVRTPHRAFNTLSRKRCSSPLGRLAASMPYNDCWHVIENRRTTFASRGKGIHWTRLVLSQPAFCRSSPTRVFHVFRNLSCTPKHVCCVTGSRQAVPIRKSVWATGRPWSM